MKANIIIHKYNINKKSYTFYKLFYLYHFYVLRNEYIYVIKLFKNIIKYIKLLKVLILIINK